MNDIQFKELVANMRQLQKRYFKERSSIILQQCKKLENDVDRALDETNKPVNNQQNLFS